jgi:hypothetical protein
MKIVTKEIELTLEQCTELEEIDSEIRRHHDIGKPGICLAKIIPGKHPDHKKIKCSFFYGEAAEAIVNFMNMVADLIKHYESDV